MLLCGKVVIIMYTAEQVAEIMHMSYRGVLRLIKQSRIKAVKVGKQWLVSEEELARIKREGA